MFALGVEQLLPAPLTHEPEIWLISTSAESPSRVKFKVCSPSFCNVLILLDEPVTSKFHVKSSDSQSISNIFELPIKTKSAFSLSALKP